MKALLPVLLFFSLGLSSFAGEMVMTDFGIYYFKDDGFDVTVEMKRVADDALAPTITFKNGDRIGSTGIGAGQSLGVLPGKWAAEFRPPHELWIDDGRGNLHLYEQTMNPDGFKASSSRARPELEKRVPPALKKRMAENGKK